MRLISQHTAISILVQDQDRALQFYTTVLGFEKRKDIIYGPGLRMLTVGSPAQSKPEIILARPDTILHGEARVQELMARIGQNPPYLFLASNCIQTYEQLQACGVHFLQPPTSRHYGTEALFTDLDGNRFALLTASPEMQAFLANHHIGNAA